LKYDVHIYAIVRVKVPGVEASDPREAAKTAMDNTDLDAMFAGSKKLEYAGAIQDFLVDKFDENGNRVGDGVVITPDYKYKRRYT